MSQYFLEKPIPVYKIQKSKTYFLYNLFSCPLVRKANELSKLLKNIVQENLHKNSSDLYITAIEQINCSSHNSYNYSIIYSLLFDSLLEFNLNFKNRSVLSFQKRSFSVILLGLARPYVRNGQLFSLIVLLISNFPRSCLQQFGKFKNFKLYNHHQKVSIFDIVFLRRIQINRDFILNKKDNIHKNEAQVI